MAREIKVTIVGDANSLSRELKRATSDVSGFGSKSARAFKLAGVAAAAGGLAIGSGFAIAVKAAASFQSELNVFQAVSQANGKQMQAVGSLAKQLGADMTLPATSAQDAAQAMTELSKAGLSVKNTMAAAKGVLQLSAAAQISNADAATITANALNAYGLAGGQATHVADLLAASSVAASGEMTDMADALRYVSATAAQAHVSIEDTVAAISEMANKGIIGGQAGSALQQMLLRLESPTKKASAALKGLGVSVYDTHGKMLPMPSLIQQFSKATAGMSDSQRNAALNAIFGARAIRAANIVLLGGKAAFDTMRVAVDRQGAASDLANAKMKGFSGSLQGLESAVQTLEITIGTPFLAALTKVAKGLSGAANWADALAQSMGQKHSFSAKIEIAWQGVSEQAQNLIDAIQAELLGSHKRVVMNSQDMFTVDTKGLISNIDWAAVGRGISDSIVKGVDLSKKLVGVISDTVSKINWESIGTKMGPGLAAMVATAFVTLLDPSFWARHWELLLAIGLTAFGGSVGKIAGKFAAPLVKVFSGAFETMALTVAAFFERFSPRLGGWVLTAFMRLPGIVDSALATLLGPVVRWFNRLGSVAKFTVKVLGIQTAINAIVGFVGDVVGWLKKLPGKIEDIFSDARKWLKGAGEAILQGLWDGMTSKWNDVSGWVGGLGGKIQSLKGPIDKDRTLLTAQGAAIIQGLGVGMESKWAAVAASLQSKAALILGEMTKLQSQLDTIQRQSEDRQNAASLRDAEAGLAAAVKSGKDIAAAEQAVADARQQIKTTALQRQLAAEQAGYDRTQAAFQKAQDRLKASQQATIDRMTAAAQAASSKLATAWGKVADKTLRAFDAITSAFTPPAQQSNDAISARRRQEDLANAVTDSYSQMLDSQDAYQAAKATSDESGNASDLRATAQAYQSMIEAQQSHARAQEDIQVDANTTLAAIQQTGWDQQRDALRESLQGMLDATGAGLNTIAGAYDTSMAGILDKLAGYGISFTSAGATLGGAFAQSLSAAISTAITDAGLAAGAKSSLTAAKSGTTTTSAAALAGYVISPAALKIKSLDSQGLITGTGIAKVHAGEMVVKRELLRAGAGGGPTVHEHHYHGPVVQDTAFLQYIQNLERQSARQNGRPAFRGGH